LVDYEVVLGREIGRTNKLKRLGELKLDEINMKVDIHILDIPALELARQITLIIKKYLGKYLFLI